MRICGSGLGDPPSVSLPNLEGFQKPWRHRLKTAVQHGRSKATQGSFLRSYQEGPKIPILPLARTGRHRGCLPT